MSIRILNTVLLAICSLFRVRRNKQRRLSVETAANTRVCGVGAPSSLSPATSYSSLCGTSGYRCIDPEFCSDGKHIMPPILSDSNEFVSIP